MGKKKAVGGRKSVKIKKAVQQKAKPIYNSDDDIPDEGADNYHKDDIDIYNEQCRCTVGSIELLLSQKRLTFIYEFLELHFCELVTFWLDGQLKERSNVKWTMTERYFSYSIFISKSIPIPVPNYQNQQSDFMLEWRR